MANDLELGYYKWKRGASWVARCRSPIDGSYVTKALGNCDDCVDADGTTILSWKDALETALAWFQQVETPGYLEAADLTGNTFCILNALAPGLRGGCD